MIAASRLPFHQRFAARIQIASNVENMVCNNPHVSAISVRTSSRENYHSRTPAVFALTERTSQFCDKRLTLYRIVRRQANQRRLPRGPITEEYSFLYVLMLHDWPALSNVHAGTRLDLHPNWGCRWRPRCWAVADSPWTTIPDEAASRPFLPSTMQSSPLSPAMSSPTPAIRRAVASVLHATAIPLKQLWDKIASQIRSQHFDVT